VGVGGETWALRTGAEGATGGNGVGAGGWGCGAGVGVAGVVGAGDGSGRDVGVGVMVGGTWLSASTSERRPTSACTCRPSLTEEGPVAATERGVVPVSSAASATCARNAASIP
jgi:hypothetical protein